MELNEYSKGKLNYRSFECEWENDGGGNEGNGEEWEWKNDNDQWSDN